MEIIYRQPDGYFVRSLAYMSFRRSFWGEWMVGDVPLNEIKGEFHYRGPMGSLPDALWKRLTSPAALSPDSAATSPPSAPPPDSASS